MNTLTAQPRHLACFALVLLTACASMRGDWEDAKKSDSVYAYRTFLSKYPQSEYAAPARLRIEELSWANAARVKSIESYAQFAKDYPNSKYAAQATEAARELHKSAYERLKRENSRDGYEAYIKKYPDGPFSKDAKHDLQSMAWGEAQKLDTLSAYKAYLRDFSDGSFANDAKRLASAKRDVALRAADWQQGRSPESCKWVCESKTCVDDLDKTLWSKLADQLNKVRTSPGSAFFWTQDGTHACNSVIGAESASAFSSCTERATGKFASYQFRSGQTELLSTNVIDIGAIPRWARDCN